jgi:hypothetical protein
MTVTNDSNITAKLILDLREKMDDEGIDCLEA